MFQAQDNHPVADVAVCAYAGARAARGELTPLVFVLLFAGLGGSTFTGLLGWYLALLIIAAALALPVWAVMRLARWAARKLPRAVPTAPPILTPLGTGFVAAGLIAWGVIALVMR
jgi:hypothetical protein